MMCRTENGAVARSVSSSQTPRMSCERRWRRLRVRSIACRPGLAKIQRSVTGSSVIFSGNRVRLNRLTASLLVLARAQTHEEVPRHEEIVLRELMEEILRGLEFKPEVELILECPPDLSVSSNRDLLEHAVRNLGKQCCPPYISRQSPD